MDNVSRNRLLGCTALVAVDGLIGALLGTAFGATIVLPPMLACAFGIQSVWEAGKAVFSEEYLKELHRIEAKERGKASFLCAAFTIAAQALVEAADMKGMTAALIASPIVGGAIGVWTGIKMLTSDEPQTPSEYRPVPRIKGKPGRNDGWDNVHDGSGAVDRFADHFGRASTEQALSDATFGKGPLAGKTGNPFKDDSFFNPWAEGGAFNKGPGGRG